jgi:hypothetical protein
MNSFLNFQSKNVFIFSILFSVLYIFFTNIFFDFEKSLIYGAADGATYMEITKNFPNFEKNDLAYTHNQRFLGPYLIGFINSFTSIDFFLIYRGVTIILFFLILYLFYKNLSFLKVGYLEMYFALSLIIFNPYLLRYYIALPTLINDLIFILCTQLLIYSFFSKNKLFSHLGVYLSFFARQTGVFFLITFLIQRIYLKKKSFINWNDLGIFIIVFIIILFFNNYHADIASGGGAFFSDHSGDVYGLLLFLYSNFDLDKLIKFLIFPLLNWAPILLLCLIRKFEMNEKFKETTGFIIISSILIFSQPILAGPEVASKNIIRLTNLAYPMVLLFIFCNSSFRLKKTKIILLLSSMLFFLWSSHPTFSIFSFLESVKF